MSKRKPPHARGISGTDKTSCLSPDFHAAAGGADVPPLPPEGLVPPLPQPAEFAGKVAAVTGNTTIQPTTNRLNRSMMTYAIKKTPFDIVASLVMSQVQTWFGAVAVTVGIACVCGAL